MSSCHPCRLKCLVISGSLVGTISLLLSVGLCTVWTLELNRVALKNVNESSYGGLQLRAVLGIATGAAGIAISAALVVAFIKFMMCMTAVWLLWCSACITFSAYYLLLSLPLLKRLRAEASSWWMVMATDAARPSVALGVALATASCCLVLCAVIAATLTYKVRKGDFDAYVFRDNDDDESFEMI
ncbi:uncharacterized protein LOC108676148 [Hyalella azteca]|uniref:Uncharacterized protein LOC108676148 n=1 Tax=Hyalella azteca TaxID=294128 RepID=A0A8B7P3Q8_HYAAZ|nr:uncharacterized protein LOC108676148 [Hyalella azteca]